MKKFTVHFLTPFCSWGNIEARDAGEAIHQCQVPDEFDGNLYCQFVAIEEEDNAEFICPHCKKEIGSVNVYSECVQRAWLDGNQTTDFDSPEVLDTKEVTCPECSGNLTEHIKE